MRVLHLTTEFPWPPTSGGPVRTLSQLRIIASLPEVEAVTLLSMTERAVPDSDVRALAAAVEKLRVAPPIFHPIHLFDFKRYVPRVVALRLIGVPYLAGKWDSPVLRRMLRRELIDAPVDVVYIDHLGMARYLPDISRCRPQCRTILDQHNVESDLFKQFAEEKTGPMRIVAKSEYRAARRFEEQALREVDAIVAISREDAQHFQTMADVRAYVVPVVMNVERRMRPHPGTPHFCYVGNLRWRPNVGGLDWFCQKVWPLVRKRIPDATFEIAGVGLEPDSSGLPVPDAWKVAGVQTVAFLEDLEPLYRRSLAMLAPIMGGSGLRIKVLQGFHAGMPVVTTPDGARGLPLVDGEQALIAGDPEGFAERVEWIMKSELLRDHLREGAYAFLENHHSFSPARRAMRGALGLE